MKPVEMRPNIFSLYGAGIGADPTLDNVPVAEGFVSNAI
jgi:hypothetical protein